MPDFILEKSMICFCSQADGKLSGTCQVADRMYDATHGLQALTDKTYTEVPVRVPPGCLVTTLINDQMKNVLGW